MSIRSTARSYYLLLLYTLSKSCRSLNYKSSNPKHTNSKRVLRLSGEGAVTKMLLYPSCTAPAIANPTEADFPRPLPAVIDTVDFCDFSAIASTKAITTLAWSSVLAVLISLPIMSLLSKLFLSNSSSANAFLLMMAPSSIGLTSLMWSEIGRILS